jgi:hypothetical protein
MPPHKACYKPWLIKGIIKFLCVTSMSHQFYPIGRGYSIIPGSKREMMNGFEVEWLDVLMGVGKKGEMT